jgi:carbamoyl-phosphate synthase large subunit
VPVVRELIELGFEVVATTGTQQVLQDHGLVVKSIFKVDEGRPHVLDAIKNNQIQLILNTPSGARAKEDDKVIRRTALSYKIPTITTVAGAKATAAAIRSMQTHQLEVKALQDYHND